MSAGGGLRILVPNSVCMARSGEDDRHVRRLVNHISPKLCRRESAECERMSFAIPNNTGSQSRRACDISRWHTRGKCWFDRLTQVIDKRSTTVTFVHRSDLSHYAVPATSSATACRSRSPVEIDRRQVIRSLTQPNRHRPGEIARSSQAPSRGGSKSKSTLPP